LNYSQYNIDLITEVGNLIDSLSNQVLDNMSPGQQYYYTNNNINIQLNKISNKTGDISISNSDLWKNTNCSSNTILCLSQSFTNELMNELNYITLNFKSIYYKNKDLPIQQNESSYVFSLDSIYFNLTGVDEYQQIQESKGIETFPFIITLKMPIVTSQVITKRFTQTNMSIINDTACVQYIHSTNSPNSTSCKSWYDYNNSKIICQCSKQGLTTNIFNKVTTNWSKLGQFPKLTTGFCIIFIINL
jgi:hypothetical protein